MQHLALGVRYDGSDFYGWQRQAEHASVQAELEQALSRIADEPVTVRVAGRTDRGVHATGQVASFATQAMRSQAVWLRGINGLTSDSIRVDWVQPVPPEFHPRYAASARTYVYLFDDGGRADPLLARRVWSCQPLDADAMHRAARHLIGEHDFTSFRGAGCQSLTPMRRVNRCTVVRHRRVVSMEIEANAFVLHMVRNIASALHDVGRGAPDHLTRDLLVARDRNHLGATAPADGLYLTRISYPDYVLPEPGGPPLV